MAPPPPAAVIPFPAPPAPQPAASTGFQVTLTNAGLYRGRVLVALRQLLQLDAPTALQFINAAPVTLAVGMTPDMAERLRATLVGSGAEVQVQGPPPPPQVAAPKAPKPEPHRSMAVTVRRIRERPAHRGARTLTGLALGRGCSYLAYGRAQGSRMLAAPDFIRIEARTMVPTAIRLASRSSTELFGNRALLSWVQDPAEANVNFAEDLGLDAPTALPAARAFLKFLNYRLVEVLGPESTAASEGAATALAISPDCPEPLQKAIAETVEQSGFPLVQLVPEPLAAAAGYLREDSSGHLLVIDWGSHGLDISVVESTPDAAPTVIDHVEHSIGGMWFDAILERWLEERLGAELSDEDRRALSLFARQFKEEASASFADGRGQHVQYCVVPAGTLPTRITISRQEMDELFAESRGQFQTAVAEAPGRVGFRAEHFDQIIVAGGASRMYFTREAVRTALGAPAMVPASPEESIARGLVLWGALKTGG